VKEYVEALVEEELQDKADREVCLELIGWFKDHELAGDFIEAVDGE
jgi:hypothetical protein